MNRSFPGSSNPAARRIKQHATGRTVEKIGETASCPMIISDETARTTAIGRYDDGGKDSLVSPTLADPRRPSPRGLQSMRSEKYAQSNRYGFKLL